MAPEIPPTVVDASVAAESNANTSPVEEEPIYCICRKPYGNRFMIECDICDEWFHGQCVGMEEHQQADIDKYHCPTCALTHGPTRFFKKRKSGRARMNVNYAALHDGHGSMQHPHQDVLQKRHFTKHTFPVMHGSDFTLQWVAENGLEVPIIFEDTQGLEMEMPPSTITVPEIAQMLGDRPLEVMDVKTQQSSPGWTLFQWAHYISHPLERKQLFNVISLEISDTPLGKMVKRPSTIRQLDWIDRFWPKDLSTKEFPKVQVYCLMSPGGSWTDFHVDFGGTSVYYHILSGSKRFFMIPPTPANLKRYEEWCKSDRQNHIFFADNIKPCYQVDLRAGMTMIIPSGWIHAVYTPEDSIVIGGNFLHGFSASLQCDIYRLESRCKTPAIFRFPFFEKLNWYAALGYRQILRKDPLLISDLELEHVQNLVSFLHQQVLKLTTATSGKSQRNSNGDSIVTSPERQLIKASIPVELLERQQFKTEIIEISRLLADEQSRRFRHARSESVELSGRAHS